MHVLVYTRYILPGTVIPQSVLRLDFVLISRTPDREFETS